jgi:hypothetical protein
VHPVILAGLEDKSRDNTLVRIIQLLVNSKVLQVTAQIWILVSPFGINESMNLNSASFFNEGLTRGVNN